MPHVAVPLASVVLAATFAWAGTMKVARADRWHKDLVAYGLARPIRGAGFLLLPWVELAIAVAMVAGRARAAAGVAVGLMALFCLAVLRARRLSGSDKIGCGCFGGSGLHDYRVLLLRNVALGALAAFVLASGKDRELGAASRSGTPTLLWWLLGAVAGVGSVWIVVQLGKRVRGQSQAMIR
jgi:hypothetical protein